nr:nickel ABC transporter permease [uncultured Blautia sp.]
MIRYIFKRLIQLIPILIGITFLSFAMMRLAGGDAVTYMYENAGAAVSQEVLDQTRAEYGLDQPFLVQYGKWFAGMITGDMGISYVSKRDVYDTFVEKLPATLLLTFSSLVLTMAISIPLGILSAVKHNRWNDYLIRFFSFIGNSMPNFLAALVLMYFFSIQLGWLPVITTENTAVSLILPTLTLAISMASKYTRQIRAAVLEELNQEYVKGARARGIRGRVIIWKNVMKASMLTILTLLSLSIGSLLGGTAIVETIFMWDGVGKMAVDAINMRDYPIIQAYVAWMAVIYVVLNLITDILYHYLDPRVRLGGDQA